MFGSRDIECQKFTKKTTFYNFYKLIFDDLGFLFFPLGTFCKVCKVKGGHDKF